MAVNNDRDRIPWSKESLQPLQNLLYLDHFLCCKTISICRQSIVCVFVIERVVKLTAGGFVRRSKTGLDTERSLGL